MLDAGRARRLRFDPGTGMARLVTERVTRAEAAQRAGRAGRVASGTCWRLWTAGEDGGLAPSPRPRSRSPTWRAGAGACRLGQRRPAVPDPATEGPLDAARRLLADLGAIENGRITDTGRAMADLPLHPRLARMALVAGKGAAALAALLSDRDPMRAAGADLGARLAALDRGGMDDGARVRLRAEAARLTRALPDRPAMAPSAALALAYPDRIAQGRKGDGTRYLLCPAGPARCWTGRSAGGPAPAGRRRNRRRAARCAHPAGAAD